VRGHLINAGQTPACPEIEEGYSPAQLGEINRCPVDPSERSSVPDAPVARG
jgi:hypothetical protein